MKLIQVSDVHLIAPGKKLFGLDPAARLDACLADIAANHADAALCVITGDLADAGEPAAYRYLAAALARLPMPVRLLLGNHDDRPAFRAAFPQEPIDADGFVQSVLDTPAGRMIFLDTHEAGTNAGRLCGQRLGWLADRLAEAGDRPFYLFLHHPPLAIGMPSLDSIGLVDAEAFAEVVRPHRVRLRHLFCGHGHRPIGGSWLGASFTMLRGTNHQTWLDLVTADDCVGSHEPPAYAVALLGRDSTVVHFHDYLDPGPKFSLGPPLGGNAPYPDD